MFTEFDQKPYAIVIRADHSADLYEVSEGRFRKIAPITYDMIANPEKLLSYTQQADVFLAWNNAAVIVAHEGLEKELDSDGELVLGVTNDVGEFVQIDIATIMLALKPMLERSFLVLREAEAKTF